MTPDRVAEVLAALACLVFFWRWRHAERAWGWPDRVGVVVLVPALVVCARLAVRLVIGALHQDWNGSRLAPTVALTRGYRLYYPATEGPVLDTIYGPATALAYLPVALFTSPTGIILCGAILNLVYVTVPLFLFVRRAAGGDETAELRALAACVGACLVMTAMSGPYYWLSMTHADGPALALGLLACVLVTGRVDGVRLAGAATLATLAAWAKQTSLPLGLSLLPWVAWRFGRAAALRYALALVGAAAVTTALFGSLFGVEAMWFNLVTLPSSHPRYFPGASGMLRVLEWLATASVPAIALLAVGVVSALVGGRAATPAARDAALVPLLPALFLIPGSLLAANKFGGNQNSFHSIYFLFASALAVLVADGTARRVRSLSRTLCYAFCALGVLVAWRYGYGRLRLPAPAVFPNAHQQAYDFARAHPGTAYFPWQPLATLLAEGRLYHFAYGVFDRALGGSAPTPEHFRADLPARLEYVAVQGRDRKAMEYLPDFTEARTSEELPGWTLLARPSSGG